MVRIQLEGTFIDIGDFEFELKWKHPITTSLIGQSTDYSTDITIDLTEPNRKASDYKILRQSSKTNKWIYGSMWINGDFMPIRAYVKKFTNTQIVFYLQRFISGLDNFLKDTRTIDNLFLNAFQNGNQRDHLLSTYDGSAYTPLFNTTPDITGIVGNIFEFRKVPYVGGERPALLANQNLITEVASFYEIELIGTPTTYMTFANQWKCRSGIMNKITNDINLSCNNIYEDNEITFGSSSLVKNLYFESRIKSVVPFSGMIELSNFKITNNNKLEIEAQIYLYNASTGDLVVRKTVRTYTNSNFGVSFSFTTVPSGEYKMMMKAEIVNGSNTNPNGNFKGTINAEITANFTALEQAAALEGKVYTDYPTFDEHGYYPCWQNLPKVTAKKLIETIALAAGKMIEYSSNKITFVDFESVFSPDNAFDASEYLQEWNSKEFKVLENRTNQVVYSSGKRIVYFDVKDETLNTEPYTVADLGCIRIEDDTATDRNTDDIVLSELTDTHFDVITKFPILYAPLVSPVVFEAKFKYFKENRKPLLVRQLNGIFIAMESVITTKDSITLRLLKIK